MDRECKMLQLCGFVKKHCSGNDLAGLWYRAEYCTGEKQDQCQRKQYMIEHGKVPVERYRAHRRDHADGRVLLSVAIAACAFTRLRSQKTPAVCHCLIASSAGRGLVLSHCLQASSGTCGFTLARGE